MINKRWCKGEFVDSLRSIVCDRPEFGLRVVRRPANEMLQFNLRVHTRTFAMPDEMDKIKFVKLKPVLSTGLEGIAHTN